MTDFQKLTSFENLYSSYKASIRGKGKKKSSTRFSVLALENLYVMKQQLMSHTYQISSYSEFVVSEPKQRVIKSGSFRDKVLQHCLCDYVLLPKMNDIFIKDNYAGQVGKGTLYGLDCLSEKLTDFYSKHGTSGYILKCDISKFFYSIDHKLLKDCLSYHFDSPEVQWICDLLIDSTDGVGLPLGNQSSQVFALIYLTGLDYFITQDLGCKYYGRYMDDFYILSDDRDYLKFCLECIREFLSTLHLSLNGKTEIVPMKKGIRFLGFHSYITEDGKVIRKLNGSNKRQIKKRLRKYAARLKSGKITRKEFDEHYQSWKNHASHGNCYKLICSMDQYVETLLSEEKSNMKES